MSPEIYRARHSAKVGSLLHPVPTGSSPTLLPVVTRERGGPHKAVRVRTLHFRVLEKQDTVH